MSHRVSFVLKSLSRRSSIASDSRWRVYGFVCVFESLAYLGAYVGGIFELSVEEEMAAGSANVVRFERLLCIRRTGQRYGHAVRDGQEGGDWERREDERAKMR